MSDREHMQAEVCRRLQEQLTEARAEIKDLQRQIDLLDRDIGDVRRTQQDDSK